MAEFCKKCFIEHLGATQDEIERIVMSEDKDFCDGCGKIDYVVDYIDE